MNEQQIQPHKITKPMQLLGAWLVGLILINATFLGFAAKLGRDSWETGALVVASIINVPIFLVALFVLQTKFRAELQEDSFYSEYLSKKTASIVKIEKNSHSDGRLEEFQAELIRVSAAAQLRESSKANQVEPDWEKWRIGLNSLHPKFKEIRQALRSSAIPLAELFGNSSSGYPDKWIISLSHSLPATYKACILNAALPFGFDGINFWNPERGADETEDVYIGSYGVSEYAAVTSELTDLIKAPVEDVDLNYYYINNKVLESSDED